MFTRTLVPLDGTDVSEGFIPFITQLARGLEMKVVLATVIHIDSASGGAGAEVSLDLTTLRAQSLTGSAPGELGKLVEEKVWARLGELAAELYLDGVPCETCVWFGSTPDGILAMAQESGCDLIAMSSRGRNVVSSGLLGSVTYRIMHESPVPVLAITPDRAKRYWDSDYGIKEIIVPLNGSELAEAALPHAASIAAGMDMRISLLRVLPVDRTFAGAGFLGLIEQATAGDDMEVEARAYLAAEVRRLRGEGLGGRGRYRAGQDGYGDHRTGTRCRTQYDRAGHPWSYWSQSPADGECRWGGCQGVGRPGAHS